MTAKPRLDKVDAIEGKGSSVSTEASSTRSKQSVLIKRPSTASAALSQPLNIQKSCDTNFAETSKKQI
jgi:hypothetical protein